MIKKKWSYDFPLFLLLVLSTFRFLQFARKMPQSQIEVMKITIPNFDRSKDKTDSGNPLRKKPGSCIQRFLYGEISEVLASFRFGQVYELKHFKDWINGFDEEKRSNYLYKFGKEDGIEFYFGIQIEPWRKIIAFLKFYIINRN